jgi:predicted nucleic acid-binding protein
VINSFEGYLPISEEKLLEIISTGIIAFDTSSLFNLYRSTPKTTSEILNYIESIESRLFLPFMVALEYHSNRSAILSQQRQIYDAINKKVSDFESFIEQCFINEQHMNLEKSEIEAIIKPFIHSLDKYLRKSKDSHPNYLINDPIRNRLIKIFSNSTGRKKTAEQLENLYKIAEARFLKKVPPGFKDYSSKEKQTKISGDLVIESRYADYLIWDEIIENGQLRNLDTILITDEKKPDWIWEEYGYRIGPRPELITEYKEKTGREFYILDLLSFLKRIRNNNGGAKITENTIREISNTASISWREEVINAFKALGGTATLDQIYSYIERSTARQLTKEWKATARKAIYYYCEDRDLFLGKEKLFKALDDSTYSLISK